MNISTILLTFLSVGSNVAAFSFVKNPGGGSVLLAATTAEAPAVDTKEEFYKAVQAAASSSSLKFDVDEYDRMATILEDVEDGCKFEEGEELCDKEIQDRLDVAGVLRLKIELQLRLDYLNSANLFAEDVRKDHDSEARKKFKEQLIANKEKGEHGADLGLW